MGLFRRPAPQLDRRYAELLKDCLDRQPHHEREHLERHAAGGDFTPALQVEGRRRRVDSRDDR